MDGDRRGELRHGRGVQRRGVRGGCFVGGNFYAPDETKPGNSCQSCQPSANTTGWTTIANSDGTTCASGQVCNAGACVLTDG